MASRTTALPDLSPDFLAGLAPAQYSGDGGPGQGRQPLPPRYRPSQPGWRQPKGQEFRDYPFNRDLDDCIAAAQEQSFHIQHTIRGWNNEKKMDFLQRYQAYHDLPITPYTPQNPYTGIREAQDMIFTQTLRGCMMQKGYPPRAGR